MNISASWTKNQPHGTTSATCPHKRHHPYMTMQTQDGRRAQCSNEVRCSCNNGNMASAHPISSEAKIHMALPACTGNKISTCVPWTHIIGAPLLRGTVHSSVSNRLNTFPNILSPELNTDQEVYLEFRDIGEFAIFTIDNIV